MARRLGISRPAITKACRDGGRLAIACKGNAINMLHPEAQRWLVERSGSLELDQADGATPARATREQPDAPPSDQNVCEHGDHPAPAGQRFCSRQCAECELTDFDPSKAECAGICHRVTAPAPAPRAAAGSRSGSKSTAGATPIPVEVPERRASSRRRPAPAPDPLDLRPIEVEDGDEPEAARSIEDLEDELGPREWTELGELAEPLTVLSERYGNAKEFEGWIRARKALEEARKAQRLRERLEGRLIARTTVARMFEHIDTAFRLLLSDASRAIATRIAPQDVAAVAALVRDVMSQHLDACKSKIDTSLASDDPLAPLAEAAE